MASSQPPQALSDRQIQQLHRQLLKKGAEVNEVLVQLLAEPATELKGLPMPGRPGERPAERLRRFLQLIDAKIQATRPDSNQRYGYCEECGAPLSFAALEQMPWADVCQACAEKVEKEDSK